MPNPVYQAARAKASRERIVTAALSLFVEHGFEPVKLQDIAAAAEVSTATLFKHFPQKESMLAAAIDTLTSLEDDGPTSQPATFTVDALRAIGLSYAKRLDNPMMLGLIRLGICDNGKLPNLGHAVSDAWRKPFLTRLEPLLERGMTNQVLSVPDMAIAARQFLGLMTDHLLWPRLLGLVSAHPAGYRDIVVDEAVRAFMARYKRAA